MAAPEEPGMKNGWIKTTSGVLGIVGTVTFGAYFVDDRFAKADELRLVDERLSVKIWQDYRRDAKARRWRLEGKHGLKCTNPRHPDRADCLEALSDQEEATEKLKTLRERR